MTKIRLEQTTSLPANTGVTWGYINDQTQSLYGAKTFVNVLSASAGIECGTYFRIQTDVSSSYIAQFNALSGNAQIGLRQSASTPNIKIGHIYQRYTSDTWFVGLNTTNNDYLFIRDPSSSAEIALGLNATTGAATFLSNIITTSGSIYLGTPSTSTIGSWAQAKTGTGLSTTYELSHYEDVSGDGSIYAYVNKFTVDYLGNAKIWASPGSVTYGTLTTGQITAQTYDITYAMQINATHGLAVFGINQNNATKWYTGFNLQRQGTEKWFIGMDNSTDNYIIRQSATSNVFTLTSAGVASSTIFTASSALYVSMSTTDKGLYWTDSASPIDGDIRIIISSGNIWAQKRVSGTWGSGGKQTQLTAW